MLGFVACVFGDALFSLGQMHQQLCWYLLAIWQDPSIHGLRAINGSAWASLSLLPSPSNEVCRALWPGRPLGYPRGGSSSWPYPCGKFSMRVGTFRLRGFGREVQEPPKQELCHLTLFGPRWSFSPHRLAHFARNFPRRLRLVGLSSNAL